MLNYTVVDGVYIFPFEHFLIRILRPQRDRYGRIFTDVEIVTLDKQGYLGIGHGDLQNNRFHTELARQASNRNSGNIGSIENALLAVYLAIREDPQLSDVLPLPKFQTAADFLHGVAPSGHAVVDGLLTRGGLYSIAARPKTGKSLLLLNLAIAIATGRRWLGHEVERGKVLMFLLEDSPRTIKSRIEQMCSQGIPADLMIHADPFRLAEENFDATVRACHGASLLVCDPVILATEVQDWNSQQEVRGSFDLWRRLSRETEVCIALSQHHRKIAGDFGDAMAGSMQAQATVDGIIELYRDRSLQSLERKMTFIGRDWPDLPEMVITLNTSTLTWQEVGTYAEAREMASDAKKQNDEAEALDALTDGPPGLTYAEWEARTGWGNHKLREIRKALGDKIAQGGESRNPQNPTRFWRWLVGDRLVQFSLAEARQVLRPSRAIWPVAL